VIFFELRKTEGTDAIRNLPIIYTWAIIKIFYTTFIKSIVEYNRKLVVKCGQIVYYEIVDAYVTEPFIVYGLQCLISDPIMEDLLPKIKKKPQVEEEPTNHLLHTDEAKSAWKEYKEVTNYSNAYFVNQKEKIKNFVNDIQKKTILFDSRVKSLSLLKEQVVVDLDNEFKITEDALMEEIIMEDQPYSGTLKTSHVSIIVKDFPKLAKTERSSAIPYKFPINSGIDLKLLRVNLNLNAKSKKKFVKPEVKKKEDGWFEHWIKSNTKNKLIHNVVDQWYKEMGYAILNKQELDMETIRQHIKDEYTLRNEEKLKGNALFNSMFKARIDEAIKKRVQEQKEIAESYSEISKGRNVNDSKPAENVASSNLLLPELRSACSSKISLKGSRSKKTFKRTPNKAKLEEARKKIESEEKLAKIAQSLKEINRKAKMQAREVIYSPNAQS